MVVCRAKERRNRPGLSAEAPVLGCDECDHQFRRGPGESRTQMRAMKTRSCPSSAGVRTKDKLRSMKDNAASRTLVGERKRCSRAHARQEPDKGWVTAGPPGSARTPPNASAENVAQAHDPDNVGALCDRKVAETVGEHDLRGLLTVGFEAGCNRVPCHPFFDGNCVEVVPGRHGTQHVALGDDAREP